MAVITDRDKKCLLLAYELHFLTIEQATVCIYGNSKVAQRRLAALEKERLLTSFPLASGRFRPTKVVYLNHRKHAGLEQVLLTSLDRPNIPKNPPGNVHGARHTIELNTVLAAFIAGAQRHGYGFSFIPEYRVARTAHTLRRMLDAEVQDPANPARTVRYRRDAVCSIGAGSRVGLFEIEYDRGTESIASCGTRKITLERKLTIFLQSLRSRSFERFSTPSFFNHRFQVSRLLLVTTTTRRLDALVDLCMQLGTHGLVYLTTRDRITPEEVFGPIWTIEDNGLVEERALVQG